MPIGRTWMFGLLIFILPLTGCGGAAEETAAVLTASTSAGINVSPSTTITTDESGLAAIISVSLGSQPTADVTIPIISSNIAEGTVSPDTLVFTKANWSTPQAIIVTGVGDDKNDGNQNYTIHYGPSASTDSTYQSLEKTTPAINLDVRTGFVDIPPLTYISGYATDESGAQINFQVKLHTKPNANVTIPISSSDEGEGTVSPNQLTFTTTNWATPQTVWVTGVEDPIAGDNPTYTIRLGLTVSSDIVYDGLDPADISLTNYDVKTGSVLVSPLSLTTTEAGGQATFTVQLTTQPFFDVTIPITNTDPSEGMIDKDSLTFTSLNWNQPQTVTVTGVSDNLADNVTYNILLDTTTSDDDNYSSLDPADVSVTNQDVRVASFVVTPISGNTNEAGGQATFTVKLGCQPTDFVTIGVKSDNENEGKASPSQLFFSNTDWDTPQTVTVTGVSADSIYDNTYYKIVLEPAQSPDTVYNGADPSDITVLNEDRKTGAVTVETISGNTDESGQIAEFQVSINHQPAADVSIAVSSSDTTEGTVSPATLTFTSADWAPKTVRVTGVDDSIADGNQTYLINLGQAQSPGDYNFDGIAPVPASVSVTNVDLVDPYGVTPRISAGFYHNLVLANDGTVWGWGACADGQLDAVAPASCSGTFTLPQRLNVTGAAFVSAGDSFSVIVKADGSVLTSGTNTSGQLGHADSSSLATVDGLSNVKEVAAGGGHVLALKNDGTLWAWGKGTNGQLGNGDFANSSTPVQATGPLVGKTVTAFAAGSDHSLAVDNSGKVYSWGSDLWDQLGLGSGDQSTATPTAITNLTAYDTDSSLAGAQYTIAAGQVQSFVVGIYSSVSALADTYGWGFNKDYQLGTSAGDTKNVPTAVSTFTNSLLPSRIDGSYWHSLGLAPVINVNKVYSWGDNDDGLVEAAVVEAWDNRGALGLGSNNITDLTLPTLSFTGIPTSAAATDINAGSNYSLVLQGDGRIMASGMDDYAQLGTNEVVPGAGKYTATPKYVDDPGDPGPDDTTIPIDPLTINYFYAYRPILSGQPATETTITSASIAVCWDTATNSALPTCGPITYYKYSTNNDTGSGSWYGPYPIATPITLSSLTGTVNLWVKGMSSTTSEIQTNASAVKISWTVK